MGERNFQQKTISPFACTIFYIAAHTHSITKWFIIYSQPKGEQRKNTTTTKTFAQRIFSKRYLNQYFFC